MRPGMCDGRTFTSYIPNSELNENIQKYNNISTNNEYRKFLKTSGETFMSNMADMSNKLVNDEHKTFTK